MVKMNWKNLAIGVLLIIAVAEFAVIWTFLMLPSQKTFNVLVVGTPSESIRSSLYSEQFKLAGINVIGIVSDSQVSKPMLEKADIVLMQGEEYCDNTVNLFYDIARRPYSPSSPSIKTKVIAIGNACSRSQRSSTVGFTALLFDGNQPPLFPLSDKPVESRQVNARFQIWDNNNPIFNAILNQDFSGNVFVYDQIPKPYVIAYFVEGSFSSEQLIRGDYEGIPAIVQIDLLPNTFVYFSFEPSTLGPSGNYGLFLNALTS